MWGANEWNVLVQMGLAVGVFTAGAWGAYTYSRSQRALRGQWLNNLFIDFYVKDTFAEIRTEFEYNYDVKLKGLVQQRLTERHIALTDVQIKLLRQLDALLNYFENLLYLQDSGLLTNSDRMALFQYWFDLLKVENRGEIRRYINLYGWERVAREVAIVEKNYLFLYGTLKADQQTFHKLHLDKYLFFIQDDYVSGILYNVSDYPGAKFGIGSPIKGQLYEIKDLGVFSVLDLFERFESDDAANSLYVRKYVRTRESDLDAWTYEYNRTIDGLSVIRNGDWAKVEADPPQS